MRWWCRDFLQLISVPRPDGEEGGGEGEEVLVEYDVEWLAILQASHHLLTSSRGRVRGGAIGCDMFPLLFPLLVLLMVLVLFVLVLVLVLVFVLILVLVLVLVLGVGVVTCT